MLYPHQVAHVSQLLQRPPLRDQKVDVVIDQTGNIGAGDEFERAGLAPIRVMFTSGSSRSRTARESGACRRP